MSSKKAQKYFEQNRIEIGTKINAGKEKIGADKAWEIISGLDHVYIGRGKKVVEFSPDPEKREEILKLALGRTGNLRAPAIIKGNSGFIGFNDEIYQNLC